jgi:anthranilate synthase/aminodeoxychorismate synthase-like glutamine amidotransferase
VIFVGALSGITATMIDNYDSFTYNIVQYLQVLGITVTTLRNDAKTAEALIQNQRPDFFVISPGPSDPDHAGVSLSLIDACARDKIPLLGVCLGHQAIGQAFGGKVIKAPECMHGKVSAVHHRGKGVFSDLPSPLSATRYHSLIVERETLPPELEITAETADGIIMGLRHQRLPIEGVQFHPESILTEGGIKMMENFVRAHVLLDSSKN